MHIKKYLVLVIALILMLTTAADAEGTVELSVPCNYRNSCSTYELYCDGEFMGSGYVSGSAISAEAGCSEYKVVYSNGCGQCTYYYSDAPSETPASTPSPLPTASIEPTAAPTIAPTSAPTVKPTTTPTAAPTVKPTTAPTKAPEASNSSSYAEQVVAEVNKERAAQGLGMVSIDSDLTAAACVRAGEIVEKFSHTRPDGTSWSTVSGKARGENIAMGYGSVDKVMAAWMSSEGHRANILRSGFTTIGVCAYEYNGVMYWVQLFGTN